MWAAVTSVPKTVIKAPKAPTKAQLQDENVELRRELADLKAKPVRRPFQKAGPQSSYGAKSKSLPKVRKEPALSEQQIARKLANYSAQLSTAIFKGDPQLYSDQVSNFMNLFMLGRENITPTSQPEDEDEEFEDDPMHETTYSQHLVAEDDAPVDDESVATREFLSRFYSLRSQTGAMTRGASSGFPCLYFFTPMRLLPHTSISKELNVLAASPAQKPLTPQGRLLPLLTYTLPLPVCLLIASATR